MECNWGNHSRIISIDSLGFGYWLPEPNHALNLLIAGRLKNKICRWFNANRNTITDMAWRSAGLIHWQWVIVLIWGTFTLLTTPTQPGNIFGLIGVIIGSYLGPYLIVRLGVYLNRKRKSRKTTAA